ncbi:MAG: peptidylprolyl isomerase [Firmicutes bacterium]|nr:peptidylprolyl isomerase [Bacillota bacterium]MDD4263392.1 peptidylprolyl isomerase [Bacillota bacterium]MDD4692963.1 peptidylprolyl isomerase [Bacillota bacterium]
MSKLRANTKAILVAAGLLLVIGTVAGYVAMAGSTPKAPSRYVAEINGKKIDRTQFERNFAMVWQQKYQSSYGQLTGFDIEPMKAQYLMQVLLQEALLDEANKMKIVVSDDEINESIKDIEEQVGGADELKAQLEYSNITMDQLKDDIKKSLLLTKLQDDIAKDITVNDEEIRAQLEEVQASHILVEDKALADNLLQQIKEGADFAELAKEHSEDPGSKEDGGNLGFFGRGVMVKAFEEAAFALEVGEVSDLVASDYGYHIITVTDRKTVDDKTFDEKKEETRETLLNSKKSSVITDYVMALEDKSNIVIYDAQLKGYQAMGEGRVEDAIKAYNEALEYAPNDPYLMISLGEAHRRKGDLDAAWDLNKKAANVSNDPYVKIQMALVGETKIRNLINAQETEEEKSVFEWASADTEIGSLYTDISTALDKASSDAGNDIMAHYQLAQVYSYFGDKERETASMAKISEITAQLYGNEEDTEAEAEVTE